MTRFCRAIQILALLVLLPGAAAAQLYPLIGVTGDSNLNPPPLLAPESLYLLSQTNASARFVMSLGNGADGESIAYNPDDALLYHGSGINPGDRFWESIDVLGRTIVSSDQYTGECVSGSHESLSMTYNPASQTFLVADLNNELCESTIAGEATPIGALPGPIKGLALAGGSLWAAAKDASTLYKINPADASVISTVAVSLGGNPVTGMNGLATHPQTGKLWGVFRQGSNPGQRYLGTIDPTTGVVTTVGTLPSSFAGIAFLPEPSSPAALGAGAITIALCGLGRRARQRA